jgi:hypothetical protein
VADARSRVEDPGASEVVAYALALNNTARRASEALMASLGIVASKARPVSLRSVVDPDGENST